MSPDEPGGEGSQPWSAAPPSGAPGSFQPLSLTPPPAVRRGRRDQWWRRFDLAAAGTLLFGLPWVCGGTLVVTAAAAAVAGAAAGKPHAGLVAVPVWLLSGALMFAPQAEGMLARLAGCRQPTPDERARLTAAWHEVAVAAGLDGARYRLWVQHADDLNAFAGARRTIAVTRYTVAVLPHRGLSAVLAHELGHHLGGHAWSRTLVYWYSLPARLIGRLVGAGARLRGLGLVLAFPICVGCALLIVAAGWLLVAAVLAGAYWLPALMLGVALVSVLLTRFSRWAEVRADRFAVKLGYGRELIQTLEDESHQAGGEGGIFARALSGRPSPAVRVRRLARQLGGEGCVPPPPR